MKRLRKRLSGTVVNSHIAEMTTNIALFPSSCWEQGCTDTQSSRQMKKALLNLLEVEEQADRDMGAR